MSIALLDKLSTTGSRTLGSLEVTQNQKRIKLPLKSVDVHAKVVDRIGQVVIKETFQNPHSEHLEAVYIFPLSGGCAVSSFQMKVGDRVIDGKVEERQAARAEYAQAIQEGKRAALLEQERDDVFTVNVGNLPPGEEITVIVTYSEKLAYFDNGTTEIRLPLVVAPRYIPGQLLERDSVGDGVEHDTNLVPDASRITPPRLVEGVDPKIALTLKVELPGEQTVEDLSCSQHATKLGSSKDGLVISLSREDELLNRDFVLRWRIATDKLQSKLLVYRHPEKKGECYGMLSMISSTPKDITTAPRDVVFVLDRSGSMNGLKMVSAVRACSFVLGTLAPKDRFAILAFDNVAEWMGPQGRAKDMFVEADEAGIEEGNKYLRTINARGGTELDHALNTAIQAMRNRDQKTGRMPIIIVLTDGEIGNESHIFARIQKELDDNRVFTIGIDTAVNDGFLRRLASLGGGTSTFVQPGAQLETALSHVGREIGTPLVMDITLEDLNCGLDKNSIAPNVISDLFEGRSVNTFFRLSGGKLKDLQSAKLKIKGRYADGKDFKEEVTAQVVEMPALAQLWARASVMDLEDRYRLAQPGEQKKLYNEIVAIAVAHHLLTKFTAFVVVDESEIVNASGQNRKIVQPVQMPDKWEMNASQPPAQMVGQMVARQRMTGGSIKSLFSNNDTYGAAPTAGWGAPPSAPMSSAPRAMPMSGANQPVAPSNAPASDALRSTSGLPTMDDAELDQSFGASAAPASNAWAMPPEQIGASNLQKHYQDLAKASAPNLEKCYQEFAQVMHAAFDAIAKDSLPTAEEIDRVRISLLQALSSSQIACELPKLQKYLRSQLIQFIAAIIGTSTVTQSLKDLTLAEEKIFIQVEEEAADRIGQTTGAFWQLNV